MKQTAVEFFEDKLYDFIHPEHRQEYFKILEQAKQMEKEQIIEAHGNKQKTKSNPNSIVTYGYTYTGEMYYNETYNK